MHTKIAIVGAGMAGLPLARVLHLHAISAGVFEAEQGPAARPQGGLLDLDEDLGQAALRIADLHEGFTKLVRMGEDAKRITDRTGRILLDRQSDGMAAKPEVDRGELRLLLMRALPADMIYWNHKLTAAFASESGRRSLLFANGRLVTCDVIVGADGAWWKVRPLVSPAEPAYTGVSFVESYLFNADGRFRMSAEAIGAGTLIAAAPGKGLLTHRYADGTIHTYAALRRPLAWFKDSAAESEERVPKQVAEAFTGWEPHLLALVTKSDTAPLIRSIDALPIGHSWRRTPGVTLVGDAAHLMSPFSGSGANLALFDGARLGQALANEAAETANALAGYEAELFPRSARAARRAAENMVRFFGPQAPYSVLDLFCTEAG